MGHLLNIHYDEIVHDHWKLDLGNRRLLFGPHSV